VTLLLNQALAVALFIKHEWHRIYKPHQPTSNVQDRNNYISLMENPKSESQAVIKSSVQSRQNKPYLQAGARKNIISDVGNNALKF